MSDLHLALIRDHLAPLLHPESLWAYLWEPRDTEYISCLLDEACGYQWGSCLWLVDWMANGPLFTFGEDQNRCRASDGKTWIVGVRARGNEGKYGANLVKAVWIKPTRGSTRYRDVPDRYVTIKAWEDAHKKAFDLKWARLRATPTGEMLHMLGIVFPEGP